MSSKYKNATMETKFAQPFENGFHPRANDLLRRLGGSSSSLNNYRKDYESHQISAKAKKSAEDLYMEEEENSSSFMSSTMDDPRTQLVMSQFDFPGRHMPQLPFLIRFLGLLASWLVPRLSFSTAFLMILMITFCLPSCFAQKVLFPIYRLTFGTLYPAYASYKAVRTKNIKEYVKWMMYWIVFAFFTFFETFTDIFLSWFPFYYEVKIVIVFWLLSPATKGSSTLYRKFVHPMLTKREQEIDDYINQAKERGYSAVLQLGSKSVNYATNVIMQTAIKGGGNLVQSIKRSYSLSDLSEPDLHRTQEEIDSVSSMLTEQRILRPRQAAILGRSSSGTRHSTGMYFSDFSATKGDLNFNVRSSEDISSGYSSAEPVMGALMRTSSVSAATKNRLKAKKAEIENESVLVYYNQDSSSLINPCTREANTFNYFDEDASIEEDEEEEEEDDFYDAAATPPAPADDDQLVSNLNSAEVPKQSPNKDIAEVNLLTKPMNKTEEVAAAAEGFALEASQSSHLLLPPPAPPTTPTATTTTTSTTPDLKRRAVPGKRKAPPPPPPSPSPSPSPSVNAANKETDI